MTARPKRAAAEATRARLAEASRLDAELGSDSDVIPSSTSSSVSDNNDSPSESEIETDSDSGGSSSSGHSAVSDGRGLARGPALRRRREVKELQDLLGSDEENFINDGTERGFQSAFQGDADTASAEITAGSLGSEGLSNNEWSESEEDDESREGGGSSDEGDSRRARRKNDSWASGSWASKSKGLRGKRVVGSSGEEGDEEQGEEKKEGGDSGKRKLQNKKRVKEVDTAFTSAGSRTGPESGRFGLINTVLRKGRFTCPKLSPESHLKLVSKSGSKLSSVSKSDLAGLGLNSDDDHCSDSSVGSEELEELMYGLCDGNDRSAVGGLSASRLGMRGRKKAAARRRLRRQQALWGAGRDGQIPSSKSQRPKRTAANKAKELTPEAEALLGQANDFYLNGKYKEALGCLHRVVALAPGAHDPFHLLGLIYETVYQDKGKALNAYLLAALILRHDAALWERVGDLALGRNDKPLAIYCYRRIVPPARTPTDFSPDMLRVAYQLAQLYLERLDFHRAAHYLEKCLSYSPGDARFACQLATCFYRLQQLPRALVVLETTVAHYLPPDTRQPLDLYTIPERQLYQQRRIAIAVDAQTSAQPTIPEASATMPEASATTPEASATMPEASLAAIVPTETSVAPTSAESPASPPSEAQSTAMMDLPTPSVYPAPTLCVDPSAEVLPVEWDVVDLCAGVLLETGRLQRCDRILLALFQHLHPAASLTETVSDAAVVPTALSVRMAICRLLLRASDAPVIAKVAERRVVDDLALALPDGEAETEAGTRKKKKLVKYLAALANAYLEIERPEEALTLYGRLEQLRSPIENADFWVKVAKCYMQAKNYQQAARFLESVLPIQGGATGHRGGSPSQLSDAGGSASGEPPSPVNLTERIRTVEARLLFFEALSHIDNPRSEGLSAREENGLSLSGNSATSFSTLLDRSDLLPQPMLASHVVTQDHRIKGLIVGSNVATLCDAIVASDRALMVARLFNSYVLLVKAGRGAEGASTSPTLQLAPVPKSSSFPSTLECAADVEKWLRANDRELRAHELGLARTPRPGYRTISTLLDPAEAKLLCALYGDPGRSFTLSRLDLWRALLDDQVSSSAKEGSSPRVCASCGSDDCHEKLERFFNMWRRCWTTEFQFLIRDTALDIRRVLLESSKNRARMLSQKMQQDESLFVDPVDRTAEANSNFGQDPQMATVGQNTSSATPFASQNGIQNVSGNVSLAESRATQSIIRMSTKGLETEVRRRKMRFSEDGVTRQMLHHDRLKRQLGLKSIDELFSWDDYYTLLSIGSHMFVQDGFAGRAVELLEATLLGLKYLRAQKHPAYSTARTGFKNRIRRLSLQIALRFGPLRQALAAIRGRHILPLLRQLLHHSNATYEAREDSLPLPAQPPLPASLAGFSAAQSNSSVSFPLSPAKLQKTTALFHRTLFFLAATLFTGPSAEFASSSVSASRKRDVVSFNRAWSARHLMEFPFDFSLTMMVAHFCVLTGRWPFAVAEYTRALTLRPHSAVASLCLATSTLAHSTSRRVQDRNQVVIRALVLFQRAQRVRLAEIHALTMRLREWALRKLERYLDTLVNTADGNADGMADSGVNSVASACAAGGKAGDQLPGLECTSAELHISLTKLTDAIARIFHEYALAENEYNVARAFHHISLEQFALPKYMAVIGRLTALETEAAKLVPSLFELQKVLAWCKQYQTSALVTLARLTQSPFPPAHTHITYMRTQTDIDSRLGNVPGPGEGFAWGKFAEAEKLFVAQLPSETPFRGGGWVARVCEQPIRGSEDSLFHLAHEGDDAAGVDATAAQTSTPAPPGTGDVGTGGANSGEAQAPRVNLARRRGAGRGLGVSTKIGALESPRAAALQLALYAENVMPGMQILVTDLSQLKFIAAHNARYAHRKLGIRSPLSLKEAIVW